MSYRVISEHRRLEDLFDALCQGFAESASSEQIWDAFEQLAEELQTHFDQEDQLYFPAICALRPDLKSPMEELTRSHEWFRNQLRHIGDHLGHGDVEGADQVFREVDESFRAHEQIEEQILARLDMELAGP